MNWNFQEILTKDPSSAWGCDTSGNIPPCGVALSRTCRCTEFHRVKNAKSASPVRNVLISIHVMPIFLHTYTGCAPDSSISIATGYGLNGIAIESRCEARFSAPVQTDPGAHPASCKMSTGSFPGVKSGRRVTLTPHPLLVPLVKKG